jgi:3-hydroxyacyl-[acyl-carrier-protein] dehydratase
MSDPFQGALARLPHGPEFRFIDKLVDLVPGHCGTAEYTLPPDAEFLKGHFPANPLMPGVLLIEACAQLLGVVAQSDPVVPPLEGLKLTAVRNAKILGSIRPFETARLRAQVLARLGPLIQGEASVTHTGATIVTVELTMSGTVS